MLKNLQTYLHDHHAGSVAAIELLDHLLESFKENPWNAYFAQLKRDIEEDQRVLEKIIQVYGDETGTMRQATAWAAEKLARMKIRIENSNDKCLGFFLALETLELGISGKLCLWRALEKTSEQRAELACFNYADLKRRAEEQRDRVGQKRLAAAGVVFISGE